MSANYKKFEPKTLYAFAISKLSLILYASIKASSAKLNEYSQFKLENSSIDFEFFFEFLFFEICFS